MAFYTGNNTLSDKDDMELLEKISIDNHQAFQILYQRYWKRLYYYSINILRDEPIAEDVIQETFINLWNQRTTHNIHNLKGYLFTSVKNQSLNSLKKVRFTEIHEKISQEISCEPEVINKINEESTKISILESLEALPVRRREIFMLSRFERLSIQEIAQKLNISPRTVENQLSLALKYLRQSLDKIALIAVFVSETFSIY